MYAHLILVTKYRLPDGQHERLGFPQATCPPMSPQMKEYLVELAKELCQKWQCECIEVNGEADHIHVLFRYAPQMHLSKFINNFKSITSRKIRAKFDSELRQFYWDWSKGFWNESYSIDSVGFAPLDVLKQYVENQGQERLGSLRETQKHC